MAKPAWIETYTGRMFCAHTLEEIHIRDIAKALSMQCRYNGHVKKHYSVAEHCVLIARKLLDDGYSYEVALTGLLHDAAEAYIGDLPGPIKHLLPEFKTLETRIDEKVAQIFGTIYPFPDAVKEYDYRILVDEKAQCYNSKLVWATDHLEALGVTIQHWDARTAELEFLDLFSELNKWT